MQLGIGFIIRNFEFINQEAVTVLKANKVESTRAGRIHKVNTGKCYTF